MKFACAQVSKWENYEPVVVGQFFPIDAEGPADAASFFVEAHFGQLMFGQDKRPLFAMVANRVNVVHIFPMTVIHHEGKVRAITKEWIEVFDAPVELSSRFEMYL